MTRRDPPKRGTLSIFTGLHGLHPRSLVQAGSTDRAPWPTTPVMELTTNEGIIIGYGPWSRPEDTDPVKWGNGELVDTLSIVFDGEAAPRRLTLDVSLNDADLRPALHSIVRLACTLTPDVRDGLYRADRRNPGQFVPASIPRDKWRVYAIDVVRAAPAVADDRLVGAGA